MAARNKLPRPTRTDFHGVIPSIDENWLEQYTPIVEQEPQEEPGFLERTWESAKAVGEGLTFLPGGVVDTVQDVIYGFDPADKEEMAQRAQTQRELEAYHKKYAGKAFEGVTEAMSSIPYSLTTMGAGLAGGTAGGLLSGGNPVVARGAGMAASGKTAYEASVAQFNRTLYDASTQVLQREPTPDEWGKIQGYFADKATEYGLWEAGPEAISNLLMTKLLGPLGSKIKGGLKGAFKNILGLYGEELGTETITQMGQGGIEADMGLRDKAPGPIDAFLEVAPATIAQTTLFAGGKKGIDLAFRRTLAGKSSGKEGNIQQSEGGTTVPPTTENPRPSAQQVAPSTEQPAPNRGPKPQAEDFGLKGAFGGQSYQDILRGQQAQGVPADRMKPGDPFDDGYEETAEWVRQNEQRVGGDDQRAVSDPWDMTRGPSISSGKTVDLIAGDYGENAPAVRQPSAMYGMNFLNQHPGGMDVIDVPYTIIPMPNAPQSQRIGSPARIPLMAESVGSPPAASRPLVTPYDAPSGPVISMPSTAPVQGVVGGLSTPAAQPAGGVPVQTPRGDTTAQAERLGMRAPDTVPEDFLRSHVVVETVPSFGATERSPRASVPAPAPRSGQGSSATGEGIAPVQPEGVVPPQPLDPGLDAARVGLFHTTEAQGAEPGKKPSVSEQRMEILRNLPEAVRKANRGAPLSKLKKLAEEWETASQPVLTSAAVIPQEQGRRDPFGTAHTEFSGKPEEAIEYLLKMKEGHVPAAFHKEGLGNIDLPWGKEGKKGFGLAHIIERRNEQGVNGVDFVRQLPHMIRDGSVEHRENYPNRAYIVSKDNETVIRLEWDGKRRAWLLTAYPLEENGSRSSDRTTDLDQTRVAGKTPPGNSESVDFKVSSPAGEVNTHTDAGEPERGAGKKRLPSPSAPVVEPKKTQEGGHGGADERGGDGPAGFPVVEDAPQMAAGQRSALRDDVVGDAGAHGASGSPRQAGVRRDTDSPRDGGHAGGRETGDDRGGAVPGGHDRSGRGDAGRTEGRDSGLGGRAGKLSADEGRGRKNRRNHRVGPDDVLVPGGNVTRAKANIEAVRLLKKLDAEKRDATPEEKKLLAQFTGWGSLAQEVFNADYAYAAQYEKRLDGALPPALRYADDKKRSDYARWKKNYGEALHPDLGGMMTAQEWDAAEKSTLNAHYTDRKVIEALWGMAEKLGFRGGRVLEPSAGTGLFFGLMPEHLSDRSSLVGVELDTLTGGILGKLYPDADIQVMGFENAKRVGDNTLDLVISNVPFGNFRVTDRKRPQYAKQSIHNYFISRSIDAARPGGLVMEITSHFTLDSLSGASIREEWGRKADLVAAIRLPGTAFEKNAGTQVTTDILIFRKKDSGLSPVSNAFRNVETVETPDGPATVNEYFVQHPEMVLGEHSLQGSMYGENEYTLKPRAGERLEDGLKRALEALPANVFGEGRTAPVEREQGIADAGMREGALVEKEGTLFTVADGALIPPEWADKPRKVKQAKSYVGVKQSVFDLINAMNSDAAESEIGKLRARLNAVYDAYVKEYGPINKNGNGFLEDDIEFPTVAAIESTVSVPVTKTYKSGKRKGESYQVDEKRVTKADIFAKRTIFPFREPTLAENVQDAIKISRIFRTGIDVGYVGKLLGMGPEAARAELLKSENVFENPETGLIEPDDIYLSGNVRKKLEMAEARREDNPAYEKNVEALRKVQPDRIGIDAIHARLGSSWVPAEVYKGFVEHLGFSGVAVEKVRLEGEEGSTQWHVEAYGGTPEARNRWGVDGASALDLIRDGLNLKRTEIYDETYGADGKASRVKNTEKTLAAQEKQRAIQNEFQSWLKKDDAAGKLVEDEYNDTFNGFVPRKFTAPDIKHFPGASHAIELRENQKIGVVRGLQESTLLAHGVGSGKTMLQITLAMEMRRLGTAKKPWIVVQASTLSQFAATFKTLYPRANILAPTEKQRNAKNRQRLLAQIASGDWDAVVTPHGFFNSISIDPQNEARFIEAQIEEYKDSLRTDFNVEDIDKKKSSESRTVKQIRKKIEKLRNRLEALSNTRKDENIYFEQLGVDALIIDEAHVYKRGSFYTKMDNVKGLDRDSSQRSMQMLMKARHVQAKTGGKNVVLATGTPISNTLTEMWTMFRYTRPDLLKEFGVEQFDDFASAFADTSVDLEETATGEFKQVERFNKFVNGPELLTLWRSGADVALTEDLDYIKGLPKLKEGRIHEVTVERSESLSNYIEALRQERAEWDRLSGKEKRAQSSVPLQIYGKAKKAAIDLRLVDSALPDEPVSKANKAVENIHDRWEENRDTKAAQIVFCDNFRSGDGAFNLFEDIKGKLIARGVPKGEIAIIHDFKTDEARKRLFDAVNRGDVRILMGTTEKLGVGVNVQERLLTAHHLDAPPRPMDFEQRNGRIRRPGNIFPEVEILTYGTRNTLDSVTFQQLISKQKFINQLLRGDVGTRSFENPFDATQATFEDMMAAFSGNPLAKEKMQLQVEVRRLEALNAAYESRLGTLRRNLRSAKSSLAFFEGRTKSAEAVTAFIKDHFPDGEIEGRKELSKEVSGWLDAETKRIEKALSGIKRYAQWQVKNPADDAAGRTLDLGNGVSAEVSLLPSVAQAQDGTLVKCVSMFYQLAGPHGIKEAGPFSGAVGLFTRLRNDLARYAGSAAENAAKIKRTKAQIASLEEELKRPFEQKKELEDARERMAEIEQKLAETSKKPEAQEEAPMASFKPGEFLNEVPPSRLRVRKAAVQSVADVLGKRAANAADTRVVQSFEELPKAVRDVYGHVASQVEGVYDTETDTVYLVADNLRNAGRAAEVWMHENMVHHGLNGFLGKDEKRRLLNRLWQGMGGMGNADIAAIARRYGVDPRSDTEGRALVMEEYLASLVEKRAADKLSGQDKTYWRRFVDAVLRAWHALVDVVTGRTGSMKYENVDRLLTALDRYVFEGKPDGVAEGGMVPAMASVDKPGSDMEAAHAAWEQVQRDAEEWGRQVDAFDPTVVIEGGKVESLPVGKTPDVLQKLGAPDLPMTMALRNLAKILSSKEDHNLPKDTVKQLPKALAEPVMVFESATSPDSFVVLTELKHEGRSVMVAVHLDTQRQRVRVNDIASAYRRGNEAWYARQIEEGRLLYQDKKKSLAWARTHRLQLPKVRKLPARLSKNRILTEEDIVKPIAPQNKPLASLRDIKGVRDITGMSAEDALNLAKNDPWIGSIFGKSGDVTLMQRIFMLPHWVAKRFPGFKAVYDRQVKRQDERAAERARSLQEIPSLFGDDALSRKDMDELKKLVWDNDGKRIAELEGVDKFLTEEELDNGRTTIKANSEWYEGYDRWLAKQPASDAVKKAMREIRVSLDNDLMRAHNRLARMSEVGDTAIQEFRTHIGHVHNYFPHHRYGNYFIQGKDRDGNVVYREHFDALHKRYARRHFEQRLEALKKDYPNAVFDLDENTKLPDEAFGRVLDPEAMEQVIKAALDKVSDKEQAKKIAEVLHESVADVMKSAGWGSHAIGRKNIPGFEKDDLFRVLYDYKSGLTGWLAKMEASRDFAEALGKINAKAHPQEWSYTSQYVKDMLRNSDHVDRTVGMIKSAAFAWYLGGNIKTAVLNLTQNVIVGVPRLQMDVEGGARAYIAAAQKQIVNQYARRFTGDKANGLTEEEARLIQELYGDALIADAYMEEVRGQVMGGTSARVWNKFMKWMGYPMSVAERFNRGSLALAAFRAARDGKLKKKARERFGVRGEKATYEQAKAFAEEVVRDSHFVYGKTNAHELLRSSPAGRGLGAAFTFKTFTANLLGLWSWALRTQGREGAIMVSKGLGATIAMGGLVSVPFYATLMAFSQAVTGDDDDWTEAIRKQLPQNTTLRDIVCYGLPAGAGVNLGGSLKMELALTGGMQKGGTPKEVLTEGLGDIIGIPWDMFVERPSKVMEAMRADNYWRAVEEVVPTAVSNGMKALRLATEGQKTIKGRDINDPGERGARKLSSGEAFGKLLGFQPVSATRSYDAYAASKHSDSVRADKADEVATIMVKALDAGDSAEMVRARKVLKDWNVKMEKEGKPHMRILMKDVQKRVTQRRRQARMTPKARQKGEAFQSVWG